VKFTNNSKWDGRDLLRLSKAVLKWSGQKLPQKLIVKVTRWGQYAGLAIIPRHPELQFVYRWVEMKVPNPHKQGYAGSNGKTVYQDVPFDVGRYAQILIHEVGHNEGLRHNEMCSSTTITIPDHILNMRVREKCVKEKPPRDIVAERRIHAQKMLRTYEGKLKRTETLVKKWRKKVRYYSSKPPVLCRKCGNEIKNKFLMRVEPIGYTCVPCQSKEILEVKV
jgi:uncharacterized CHY-type Zn-finger protein